MCNRFNFNIIKLQNVIMYFNMCIYLRTDDINVKETLPIVVGTHNNINIYKKTTTNEKPTYNFYQIIIFTTRLLDVCNNIYLAACQLLLNYI